MPKQLDQRKQFVILKLHWGGGNKEDGATGEALAGSKIADEFVQLCRRGAAALSTASRMVRFVNDHKIPRDIRNLFNVVPHCRLRSYGTQSPILHRPKD